MSSEKKSKRKSYPPEFKAQAVELAKEIGTLKAAEKLGIVNHQSLGAWIRYSKKMDKNQQFTDIKEARKEMFEYMNWYNRERLHSSLDYVYPKEFRKTKGVLKT